MRLLIGADLVPTKATEQYFVAADTKALYGDIMKVAEKCDRVIVNLECALTKHDVGIKKFGPNLKADPKSIEGILALGVTDVALANNHVFDFGKQGMIDTLATLDAVGLPYMGVGENDTDSRKPYFIEAEGKRIGFINVNEHEYTYALPDRMGVNPFDPFLTMQDIREAKAQCDHLIVLYHGGKEYCKYPSPRVYNLCHEMVYCGADVVLTQHSHCIGCYEQFEGAHILYGQGNFNFVYGEERGELWNTALLVELNIGKDIDISFHPIVATATGCDLAKGSEAADILTKFNKRNNELAEGKWIDGWRAFCHQEDIEPRYYAATQFSNDDPHGWQLFAHYLDCEAHTDVWRELYKTWNHTNEKD